MLCKHDVSNGFQQTVLTRMMNSTRQPDLRASSRCSQRRPACAGCTPAFFTLPCNDSTSRVVRNMLCATPSRVWNFQGNAEHLKQTYGLNMFKLIERAISSALRCFALLCIALHCSALHCCASPYFTLLYFEPIRRKHTFIVIDSSELN